MDYVCSKCNTKLSKCIVYGAESTLSAVKQNVKTYTENSSRMEPFVCSSCGHIEWYVEKPDVFKQ